MRQNLFVAKLEKKRKERLDKIADSNIHYNEDSPKKKEFNKQIKQTPKMQKYILKNDFQE